MRIHRCAFLASRSMRDGRSEDALLARTRSNMTHAHNLRKRSSSHQLAPQCEPVPRPSSRASTHSHASHGSFGHVHPHTEDEAAVLISALKGSADEGSRITLIGLASNVGLTAVKGVAGWWLSSASLVADAGHSLSDLAGDFAVLLCWKVSRRKPTPSYPFGFGKYESLGTLIVAILLLLGGLGIGLHSYSSLTGETFHGHHHHSHHQSETVDPNAAWFALASILVKEWLYRATLSIATKEQSNVLTASAYHHRSDAYSSIVALLAIAGSWIGFEQADPLGGLAVAAMILLQGFAVALASVQELLDQAADPQTAVDVRNMLANEFQVAVATIRLFKSGALHLVDAVVEVSPKLTVRDTAKLEADMIKRIRTDFPAITEVAVRFRPAM